MRPAVVALVALVAVSAAAAARLPGVRTPTRNISCFYVPIKPTAHGTLLCDVRRSTYASAQQRACMKAAGLDWHGFELAWNGRAQRVCSGGILYDAGRDTPALHVLRYGSTWRYRGFTCVSRRTGLTCTNGRGHGLFLARETYRLW